MINKNDYINLNKDELANKFKKSCEEGNLEIVKYLLTSKELNNNYNLHLEEPNGFIWACEKGHLDIVKYLITSPELNNHVDFHIKNDYGFKIACFNENFNIIEFFIFEVSMTKNEEIEKYLSQNPNYKIENMFKLRELNNKLNNDLISDKGNQKKAKL